MSEKNIKSITLPLDDEMLKTLKCGDEVLLNGKLYTARDAAHKRLTEMIERGEELPIRLEGSTFYYVGPTPEKPNQVIGSAGPTTSTRMDAYSPKLIAIGQKAMIGKGGRSTEVIEAMKCYGAVYFGAIGGAGALLSKHIKDAEIVAFEDLGTEAIRELVVKDFPVIVAIDSEGNSLYEQGREKFLKFQK